MLQTRSHAVRTSAAARLLVLLALLLGSVTLVADPAHARLRSSAYEQTLARAVNDARARHGLGRVRVASTRARCYDRTHAEPWARLHRSGRLVYRGEATLSRLCGGPVVREWSARTTLSPTRLVRRWLRRDAHPALLGARMRHLAVGAVRLPGGRWTLTVVVGGRAADPDGGDATASDAVTSYRAAIRAATADVRADAGVAGLAAAACLNAKAQRHAEWMAAGTDRFQHQDLGAVLADCAGLRTVGENIAYTYSGAGRSMVVDQWMNSAGHRANLLNPGFSLLGVGAAQAADGRWYGVQVFGG